jgi:creatinine amidohydrolase
MYWDRMTSVALDRVDRNTAVLIPLGATEQHGPHLPLCTDRLLAETICGRVESSLSGSVLVLPPVAVGCSAHHLAFPGTLTLRHASFFRQVRDILSSVAQSGFRSLVLLNGHGGNQGIGNVILEEFGASNPRLSIVFTSWWQLAAPELLAISTTGRGGIGHACELETSLMLAVAPELVDRSAVPARSGRLPYEWNQSDLLRSSRARLFQPQDQIADNGVYGDPAAATAEKGVAALDAISSQLQRLVTSLGPSLAGQESPVPARPWQTDPS